MKWQSIENKIKTALSGHRSEVDADAIWAAIEPGVDAVNKRKKRRGFFLWFWLAGVVVAGSALGYFYQNETGGRAEQPAKIPVAELKKENGKEAIAAPAIKLEHESNENRAGVPGSESAEPSGGPVFNRNASLQGISTEKAGNQNGPIQDVNASGQPAASTTLAVPPEHAMPADQDQASGLEWLPGLPLALLDLPGSDLLQREEVGLPEDLTIAPVRRKSFSFSAGVQGSISFVDRKLESDSSYFHLDLLDLRKKTERELEAIQAGLRLTVRHSSGLGLTSGVNYTQINERFRYNTTVSTVDTVYGIKYYVITINNDTVPFYDDIPLEKKTTYRKVHYNKYRMIDVPVLADYRHEGRDFSLGIQAGVFVNVSLAAKGRFLAAENEFEDLSDTDIFRSKVGLSYYFGMSAGYLLNENLELTISPFMRLFPKSFTESSYGLTQRYNLFGLNVGAVYHFE